MDVPLFLAADYAKVCDSGKVDILGIFNVIFSENYPLVHKSLFLITKIEFQSGEFEHEHDIKIIFIDEDGNEHLKREGKVSVKKPDKLRWYYADVIMQINNLRIDRPGFYEFRLLINHETKRTLTIQVVQLDRQEDKIDDDLED